MNVNAVVVLLDHTVKKSMLVHQVLVRIMEYVLTYRKDMREILINVYALMVSVLIFGFFFSFQFLLYAQISQNQLELKSIYKQKLKAFVNKLSV